MSKTVLLRKGKRALEMLKYCAIGVVRIACLRPVQHKPPRGMRRFAAQKKAQKVEQPTTVVRAVITTNRAPQGIRRYTVFFLVIEKVDGRNGRET